MVFKYHIEKRDVLLKIQILLSLPTGSATREQKLYIIGTNWN